MRSASTPRSPTPVTDSAAWSRVAARATHPASAPRDEPWLWSIASGLAASIAAGGGGPLLPGRTEPATGVARGTLLLSTAAYQAWHVVWPAGLPIEMTGALHVQSFCVVEGALLLVDHARSGEPNRRYGTGDGTVLRSPHMVVIAEGTPTRAIHVVLWGGDREPPLPWTADVPGE